jgi:thymidylate kinase
MIIEFFGPPCAGKTTFAAALTEKLRELGGDAKLVLSYRPSEHRACSVMAGSAAHLRLPPGLARLIRPIVELIAATHSAVEPKGSCVAAALAPLRLSPTLFHSLKVRQYLLRLSRTWHSSMAARDIVVFDQGFIQAIYSCALLARQPDQELISQALDAVPQADLLVRVHTPLETLEARLAQRRQHQGRIERFLDASANLGSLHIFEQIEEALRARGRPLAHVNSGDQRSLGELIEWVEAGSVGHLRKAGNVSLNGKSAA